MVTFFSRASLKTMEPCEAVTGGINSHSCFIIINIAAAAASAAAVAVGAIGNSCHAARPDLVGGE